MCRDRGQVPLLQHAGLRGGPVPARLGPAELLRVEPGPGGARPARCRVPRVHTCNLTRAGYPPELTSNYVTFSRRRPCDPRERFSLPGCRDSSWQRHRSLCYKVSIICIIYFLTKYFSTQN